MQQQVGAIPAQCKRCGEVFDVSYDLEGVGQEGLILELVSAARNPRAALCWECRARR